MKISKSKQELARIISENGGWRDCAEFAAQDKKSYSLPNMFWFYTDKPKRFESASSWRGQSFGDGVETSWLIKNWHQTILSRDEYFRLYPVAETEPEQVAEAKPTIEQLAAEYQSKLAIATQAQEEADSHRCGAEVALSKLEVAVKELGFKIEPISAKQEPELVITDWLDLRAGDVISVSGKWWGPDSEYTVDENDGSRDAPIRVGGYWAFIGECSFKFISRP